MAIRIGGTLPSLASADALAIVIDRLVRGYEIVKCPMNYSIDCAHMIANAKTNACGTLSVHLNEIAIVTLWNN